MRAGDFENEGYTRVQIPASVVELGSGAFRDWTSLRALSFAQNSALARIGPEAFARSGLREFVAPAGLCRVGPGAFFGCSDLERAILNDNLVELGGSRSSSAGKCVLGVFERSGVEIVRLPRGLVRVEERTFAGCARLKRLELPEGLQQLGVGCARESGLEEVEIPASVGLVDACAFCGCGSLREVRVCAGSALQLVGRGAFAGTQVGRADVVLPVRAFIEEGAFGERV